MINVGTLSESTSRRWLNQTGSVLMFSDVASPLRLNPENDQWVIEQVSESTDRCSDASLAGTAGLDQIRLDQIRLESGSVKTDSLEMLAGFTEVTQNDACNHDNCT